MNIIGSILAFTFSSVVVSGGMMHHDTGRPKLLDGTLDVQLKFISVLR